MFEVACVLGLQALMILLALYYEATCGIGVMYFIVEVIAVVLIGLMFYKMRNKKW